jgi:hypothetical protein
MNVATAVAACLLFAFSTVAEESSAPVGSQTGLIFDHYSGLSRSTELLRRLTTPLDGLRVTQASMQAGKALRDQSIDLSKERFTVFVPPPPSPPSYAVLVFVSPWDDAAVPAQWIPALDRHGMIFVTAANSGNAASVLGRREPLALLALQNILDRYPVDPRRVYIGGFSGGSRVALRLATGYPDVFHGALLIAGSDPIGNAHLPLPPRELFLQFQQSTRLVYATGERDEYHLSEDAGSRRSMQDWCVAQIVTELLPFKGHELPGGLTVGRLLDELVKAGAAETDKLSRCRARIDEELDAQLQKASDFAQKDSVRDASRLLDKIDARFGGLAAPRSVELAKRFKGAT